MPGSLFCPRLARELLADKHRMKHRISRGTGSSNPSPSSRESTNLRSLGVRLPWPDERIQALNDFPFEMVSPLWLLPLPNKPGICEIGSRHCGNDRVDTETDSA